ASTAALDFLDSLGPDAVRQYDRDLARRAASELAEAFGTALPFPPALQAAMVTIRPPGEWSGTQEEADRLHRLLRDRHAIEVPVFPWGGTCWIRISAQVYNELDDYRRLARAVHEVCR
ncbi:MAG: aminotransferase class V-fold PLP-dependent enzyme, partial [Deltaproteobacteria bacterium]|nr:aminotransferase class V-fold PLP-dependent enzyme [Deltaproteobacteria bacterium]